LLRWIHPAPGMHLKTAIGFSAPTNSNALAEKIEISGQ